jgi:hypothetical protein
MSIQLVEEKTEKYRNVTITVYSRTSPTYQDFMYRTNISITGAGQASMQEALDDAKRAIDKSLDEQRNGQI